MASQGANICPSFISLSLSQRPPKKRFWSLWWGMQRNWHSHPQSPSFLLVTWSWLGMRMSIPVQGNLRRSLPGFFFFIGLEQKGFLRLVVAFAFRETSMFSLKVRRQQLFYFYDEIYCWWLFRILIVVLAKASHQTSFERSWASYLRRKISSECYQTFYYISRLVH